MHSRRKNSNFLCCLCNTISGYFFNDLTHKLKIAIQCLVSRWCNTRRTSTCHRSWSAHSCPRSITNWDLKKSKSEILKIKSSAGEHLRHVRFGGLANCAIWDPIQSKRRTCQTCTAGDHTPPYECSFYSFFFLHELLCNAQTTVHFTELTSLQPSKATCRTHFLDKAKPWSNLQHPAWRH